MTDSSPRPRRTAKFEARKAAILDAASEQINRVGTRGMTLTAVARELGIDTSSVTYYYRRKDDLAAACLERTLERLAEAAASAADGADERHRVGAFVASIIDLHRRQRADGVARLAVLSDLQSLDRQVREPLLALYRGLTGTVRSFFDARPGGGAGMRALALLGIVHWMPAWIDDYLIGDLARIERAVVDVFGSGISDAPDANPEAVADVDEPADPNSRFLLGATELINEHGYHGASVDKIAAHLGVSIGSFYHHLDNKDDLVVACFERSFALIEAAFRTAADEPTPNRRLRSILLALFRVQLEGRAGLLRSGAYQALPPTLRRDAQSRFAQLTRHLAGVVADGVAPGAVRPCDPMVAAHCMMATVLAAIDLRGRAGVEPIPAAEALLDIVVHGAFRRASSITAVAPATP